MTFGFKDQSGHHEPPRTRGPLPYEPDEWNRRLAEARARREATLKERGAVRRGRASIVRTAIIGDDCAAASATTIQSLYARPAATVLDWLHGHRLALQGLIRGPAALLLIGGLIGASLTAVGAGALTLLRQPPPAVTPIVPTVAVLTPPEEFSVRELAPLSELVASEAALHGEFAFSEPPPPEEPIVSEVAPPEEFVVSEVIADAGTTPVVDPPAIGPEAETAVDTAVAIALAYIPVWIEDPQGGPLPAPPAARVDTSQVVVLAPPTVGEAARNDIAALVHEAGWQAETTRTSPFTVSKTHVRYYHADDRAAAQKLAALFSAGARDFTDVRPSPPTGMVELWLAGGGSGKVPAPHPRGPNPIVNALERIAVALDRFE